MDGINSDKVNIHLGGESGGGGMAALVAALGNRNQGDNTAALIAALGNRNDGHHNGDGLGGSLGLIALLALLGRRGFGGDDKDCGGDGVDRAALIQTIMESVADIRAQVPATALETQNALANLALAMQQGFANNKDATQAAAALNLSATNRVESTVLTTGLQTQIAVGNDGDKTRALLVSRWQQEDATTIAQQNARIVALETRGEHDRHHAEVREQITITNTNTAVANAMQQQAQAQMQSTALNRILCELAENTQLSRATAANTNFIVGNQGPTVTGPQTATPTATNVRA